MQLLEQAFNRAMHQHPWFHRSNCCSMRTMFGRPRLPLSLPSSPPPTRPSTALFPPPRSHKAQWSSLVPKPPPYSPRRAYREVVGQAKRTHVHRGHRGRGHQGKHGDQHQGRHNDGHDVEEPVAEEELPTVLGNKVLGGGGVEAQCRKRRARLAEPHRQQQVPAVAHATHREAHDTVRCLTPTSSAGVRRLRWQKHQG